jgi:CheY-like chemotaxis protein
MDGYEAARILRRSQGTACAVLMALTAGASPVDRAAALQAGFDFHVAKPVDGAGLAQIVRQAVAD